MRDPEDRERAAGGTLVDFPVLARRVGVAALALGAAAFVAVVVEGLAAGLTFGLMLRWAAVFLALLLVVSITLAAASAVRGADRARRRGERLSTRGVGLTPPRRGRGGERPSP